MQKDKFTIIVQMNGQQKSVDVMTKPSTDDVDTYVCSVNGEDVSQIRKEGEEWKQLWGELSDEQIDALGSRIDDLLTK